ncbi:hypothetical protein SY89_03465 [Halolamina pelagica]|uniref:MacB-like periplasmic core domain-containing protein n=1 Tax=Halolamina pelagica TaxID=699431 RepID=A0A0P7GL54_9EURY|nr:ABC transporter permease [Halolamina pelagica]KPN29231.1 hypothetical protein SY89_03465 [Halolamina pelagica]
MTETDQSGDDPGVRVPETEPAAADPTLGNRLARRFPAASLALRNLSRQRLRAGLATLGIVIGVFAVVTLGMLGTALQTAALAELGGLGNQVIVSPADGGDGLGARELGAIRQAAAGGGTVVPLKSGGASVSGPDGQSFAQLYGTTQPAALFGVDGVPEYHRQGAVVGDELAEGLGAQVGSTVEIEGNRYRVVAIIDSGGRSRRSDPARRSCSRPGSSSPTATRRSWCRPTLPTTRGRSPTASASG